MVYRYTDIYTFYIELLDWHRVEGLSVQGQPR